MIIRIIIFDVLFMIICVVFTQIMIIFFFPEQTCKMYFTFTPT